jgi:hypothetical protein
LTVDLCNGRIIKFTENALDNKVLAARAQDHKTKIGDQSALSSQASDWLKYRPVAISGNQMLEI